MRAFIVFSKVSCLFFDLVLTIVLIADVLSELTMILVFFLSVDRAMIIAVSSALSADAFPLILKDVIPASSPVSVFWITSTMVWKFDPVPLSVVILTSFQFLNLWCKLLSVSLNFLLLVHCMYGGCGVSGIIIDSSGCSDLFVESMMVYMLPGDTRALNIRASLAFLLLMVVCLTEILIKSTLLASEIHRSSLLSLCLHF